VTCYTEGFSHFVTSMTAPVASGWSDLAGWDFHPLESAAFAQRTQKAVVPLRHGERIKSTLCGNRIASPWLSRLS
jgi:hypothetical protein